MSSQQCIKESKINRNLICLPQQNCNEHITAAEDVMQIALVPELPLCNGYEIIVTVLDVFSRYFIANRTSNQVVQTIAKDVLNIMTEHAYLPTTLISDKVSAFPSHVNKEKADDPGITLKHATTKHAQKNGTHEQSDASIKQALMLETGERNLLWHKYVSIAILNYNAFHQARSGCEPSRVFRGRNPYNVPELTLGVLPHQTPFPTSQFV